MKRQAEEKAQQREQRRQERYRLRVADILTSHGMARRLYCAPLPKTIF